MNLSPRAALIIALLMLGCRAIADMPGPPPGWSSPTPSFLPGNSVDDASGAPSTPGPFVPVGDTTKPNVPNVVFTDFGSVSSARTAPIRHDFVLQNISSAPVIVDRAEPGCGCMRVSLDSGSQKAHHRIGPGATFTVHVSIDTTQLYAGQIDKVAWIFLAEQKTPAFTMHLIGRTIPMATFAPTELDLGLIAVGSASAQTLSVTADTSVYGVDPPNPFSVNGSVKIVRDSTPPVLDGVLLKRTYTVILSSHAHIGLLSDMIAMPLKRAPLRPGPVMPVTGTVMGDIAATPATAAFGTATLGKAVTQEIVLTARSPVILNDIIVKCDSRLLSAKIVRSSRLSAILRIVFLPTVSGALQATISLITSTGQQLDIPVQGWAGR